jgi:hypothetical protein
MKTDRLTKIAAGIGIVLLTLALYSSEAFSWGFATHTYINDHIGKRGALTNANEIYGGVGPDLFNYLFDYPEYLAYLTDQTHHHPKKVWSAADYGLEKSLAFGFMSHNDTWGIDYTAHHACRTCAAPEGYAIAKAKTILAIAPLPTELGIPEDVAVEIIHEIVENSVDILIQRTDPLIGQKIMSAALLRSPQFPRLLVKVYGQDFAAFAGITPAEAAVFIISTEREFRKSIALYGLALSQDEETAIQLIAEQTADLAGTFLGGYGIPLPPKEQIIEMVVGYMTLAISICEPDYLGEVKATIRFVDHNLAAHGIYY